MTGTRGRKSDRPLLQRPSKETSHQLELIGTRFRAPRWTWAIGLLAHCVITHHGPSKRGVTAHEPGVQGHVAIETLEPGAERVPTGVDRPQRGIRNALYHREHLHDVLARVVGEGCHRETAVATDDRGYPVPRRRRQLGVPVDLAVVVGVDVYETGGHCQPGHIEIVAAGLPDGADLDDTAVLDAYIG